MTSDIVMLVLIKSEQLSGSQLHGWVVAVLCDGLVMCTVGCNALL